MAYTLRWALTRVFAGAYRACNRDSRAHNLPAGAGDRATAIRWDMDANNLGAHDYCHLAGIAYSNEAKINAILGRP